MNYLLEAMETLGVYYTPSQILALGYGDGKTTFEHIVANPPFTTRNTCTRCNGGGYVNTKHGPVRCPVCQGKGWHDNR